MLFQAIGECPLVKGVYHTPCVRRARSLIVQHEDIYMQAFDRLRPVFLTHELKSLCETMVERGIRLRKGLEEEIEGWSENYVNAEEGDELDELEYNSRELARLKPY